MASKTTLVEALRQVLDWIDGVPQALPLPAMPGFDRDLVESLLDGVVTEDSGFSSLEDGLCAALGWSLGWVDALPDFALEGMPTLDRAAIEPLLAKAAIPSKFQGSDLAP